MLLFIYMDSLDSLNKRIKQFCQNREWSQFHDPKNLALSLQLEASEVLELFQWTKDNEINPKKKDQLGDELADVMYWLIMLSNHYEIDLIQSLNDKMEKNEDKYPVEKAKGKSAKYTDL